MKILHVLNHSFPLLDGYASRSQNILKAQKNMGWYPVVLTSSKHEDDLKKECLKKEHIEGFTFYRTGLNPVRVPILAELALMFMLFKRMINVIKKEKPDILHAHSPVLNYLPTWIAGKIFSLPVVYEIRAYWEDAGVDNSTYTDLSIKYKLVQALEKWACNNVEQVAVLCDGIREDMEGRGVRSSKMTPAFNGISPDNLKPCKPDKELVEKWNLSGKKVIGFIGSFYRYEGLDLLIEAFSKIAGTNPDLVLLLVGGGEVEQQLKDQVSMLNLDKRVLFPGRVPHDRVRGVYAMMDIMIYPRYSIRLTELVTPLKPLEAMAMGKAVIASDIGGHRELVTHDETGILFPAGDADGLAGAITSLLENTEQLDAIREKGMKYVLENKTWKKTISVYKDIYSRLPGIELHEL
jgi:PEP-CTERM/exosortase A-associated glycosyltransferase